MTSPLSIRAYQPKDRKAWDSYVHNHADSTFFHKAGWAEVLYRAFGHQAHYLIAEQDQTIVGVLPLGQVKSPLFGNSLVSVPFCVYGGALAETVDIEQALTKAACELAEDLQVDYLELRNRQNKNPEWPRKELYVTFRKAIAQDHNANMQAIPRKQRAMVRKGEKLGLKAGVDNNTQRFFKAYSHSVWRLGTPVFPHNYFDVLLDVFGDDAEVLTITNKQDELVSSVLSFYYKDEVLPYYGGGLDNARMLAGNDYLYWALMQHAVETRQCHVFDFGRSKLEAGSYKFKKHWGFEPEPLHYEFYLVKATSLPDVNPNNPKYAMFIKMWQRMPYWLSTVVGPELAKDLG